MQDRWPCVTCSVRNFDFCAALLGKPSDELNLHQQPSWQSYRTVRSGENIIIRNQISENVFVLCDGWAFRFFQLPNGRRQILHFLLPGDLFSAVMVFDERSISSVQALTDIRISGYKRAEVQARLAVNPAISQALSKSCVVEIGDSDQLLAALGHRSAEEKISYLFLHLIKRIAIKRVIRDQRYPFPLLQQHIAETVGLTPVHVSRVIGLFRDRNILDLSGGILQIHNFPELERIGCMKSD
ncbi:MAG TPA: Crp/Fnr family transcriptional regulator, partial [Acidobacteriota bacterium]